MPSANGFKLVYKWNGEEQVLVASWPAPYFLLTPDDDDRPGLLIHYETRDEAETDYAHYGGVLLDAAFCVIKGDHRGLPSAYIPPEVS